VISVKLQASITTPLMWCAIRLPLNYVFIAKFGSKKLKKW